MILFNIFVATFVVSLIALVGVLILFLKDKIMEKILLFLVALAAGGMIGGAFLHLMPEALEEAGEEKIMAVFLYFLVGFVSFYILENFIHWHHHHSSQHPKIASFSYLILVSDAVHNFIDGVIIAVSFVVSFPLGVVTTIAVALHEIPQQLGDYGVLLYGGIEKVRALFLNYLSAVPVIIGGVCGFYLAQIIGDYIIYILPFAAGSFVYIAASDLIPEIKNQKSFKRSISYFLVFVLGISLMLLLQLFHSH